MRWKPHVRFGGRAEETDQWRHRHGASVRSHLANSKLDECRRRVQNETVGHRGRKADPLYRARRLLTKAHERLDVRGEEKLAGLLEAGDPRGEVRMAWHAKEVVRSIYEIPDADVAATFVAQLGHDLQDDSCPPEVCSLGRTILRWREQIAAWHQAHFTNAATEAANNLIKRVKRVAFGFTRFRNYRIRVLLYAGRPNWDLLATVTPRSLVHHLRVGSREAVDALVGSTGSSPTPLAAVTANFSSARAGGPGGADWR